MAGKPIYAAMQVVQRELKAPKGQTNSFGGYKYRSCEDIVEAALKSGEIIEGAHIAQGASWSY